MPIVADKYLPNLTETTHISDADLLYFTGSATGDYKVLSQDLRKVLNPVLSVSSKSVSYPVTAADCVGKWFSNKTASGEIVFTLPAVASGLIVCFIVESYNYLKITPQAGDKIVSLAVDGQSIRSRTLRNSIILKATAYDWYVLTKTGTWSAV